MKEQNKNKDKIKDKIKDKDRDKIKDKDKNKGHRGGGDEAKAKVPLRKKDIKAGEGQEDNIFIDFFNAIFNDGLILFLVLLALIILLIFYIYKFNPFNIATKHPNAVLISLAFFITIVAGVYFFMLNYKEYVYFGEKVDYLTDKDVNEDMGNFFLKMFAAFGMIGGILGAIYGIYWLLNNVQNTHQLISWFFIAISIIVGLGIFYLIFENVIDPNEDKSDAERKDAGSSFFTLIKELFFFIPCLLIDLVEYFEKQFGMTTKPVWILLIIELIIILLYFLLPLLASAIILHEGKEILKGPIFTDKQKILGTYQGLSGDSNINYNYNYGLSFWVYINPQPTSTNSSYTKYTSLLNYANKPNILYNAEKNTIKIECQKNTNDIVTIYEMKDLDYQKWMHFVINYSSGIVDVFIDNELVASVDQVAPYMTISNVTSGAKNGIHGGIRNVAYFKNPISKSKMDVLTYERN